MDVTDALVLARELMEEHGLQGWGITLDRAKTRAGACRFTAREISLSAHLTRLHDEDEVRDTILHEIAHALVGPGHGHDRVWQATALAIGCSGERCSSRDAPQVPGAWVGACQAGHVVHRHRRPSRVLFCRQCSGGFGPDSLLRWTFRGERVSMNPNYVAELKAVLGKDPSIAPGRFGVGTRVRIIAPGQYHGVTAPIVKRGRTRYHLELPGARLTVPFAMVDVAD